jgi:hypothetical protein
MLAMPDSVADDCTDAAIAFRLGQLGHELVAEASEVACRPAGGLVTYSAADNGGRPHRARLSVSFGQRCAVLTLTPNRPAAATRSRKFPIWGRHIAFPTTCCVTPFAILLLRPKPFLFEINSFGNRSNAEGRIEGEAITPLRR